MVHDFGATLFCNAINFKRRTFLLNSISKELLRELLPHKAQYQLKREGGTRLASSEGWQGMLTGRG